VGRRLHSSYSRSGIHCDDNDSSTSCGCVYISGIVCPRLGTKRIGNMIVLKESELDESSEEEDDDDEGLDEENMGRMDLKKSNIRRKKLDIVIGPFWPMMVFVTYPLVLIVSLWTFFTIIISPKELNFIVVAIWYIFTFGLLFSLFQVSCRDPGILKRYRKIPKTSKKRFINGIIPYNDNPRYWSWNDNTLTYCPRSAVYDSDCACFIEDFDHTCPWTGTAIGKKNIGAFQSFVALVFVCLILDICLLAGALDNLC